MTDNFFKVLGEVSETLYCEVDFLEKTAIHLGFFMPDSPVVKRLFKSADLLRKCDAKLHEMSGKETSDFVKNCDQNSKAMLRASLVGLAIGSGKSLHELGADGIIMNENG